MKKIFLPFGIETTLKYEDEYWMAHKVVTVFWILALHGLAGFCSTILLANYLFRNEGWTGPVIVFYIFLVIVETTILFFVGGAALMSLANEINRESAEFTAKVAESVDKGTEEKKEN